MSRRTKKIYLTLAGSTLLLTGCPATPQPLPPAAKVVRNIEVPAHEVARPLTAIVAGNLLGIANLGPLPMLTATGAALVPEGPEEAPAEGHASATPIRRPIYRASYAYPHYRYGSGFHAPVPIILTRGMPSQSAVRTRSSTTSRPATASRAGGFGSTGRSVSS